MDVLDNRNSDLWQGGPWEQPSPSFSPPPAVFLPDGARPARPVLRPRRRRRHLWPFLALGAGVLLGVFLLTGVFFLLTTGGDISLSPPSGGQPSQTQEYSTQPPSIPRAQTGTGGNRPAPQSNRCERPAR